MVRDSDKVSMEHFRVIEFSEAAIILVAMATEMGETLRFSSRNADKKA